MINNRLQKETELKRFKGIEEPVLNDNGKPILTSVWCPSKDNLKEYKIIPFYKSIKLTGRTFPFVVRNLIRLYSDENNLIYDPMFGTGTTLYEAIKLNRNVMGSELNTERYNNFIERWQKYTNFNLPKIWNCNAENLKHLKNETIDLIIMSFPWFSSWKFADNSEEGQKSMEKNKDIDSFIKQSTKIYKECYRVLKPNGFVCNILGNTFIKGVYYPITLHMIKAIEAANLNIFYQFWNLRTRIESIKFPWARTAIDTRIKKADKGVGWDIHEDIIIARK